MRLGGGEVERRVRHLQIGDLAADRARDSKPSIPRTSAEAIPVKTVMIRASPSSRSGVVGEGGGEPRRAVGQLAHPQLEGAERAARPLVEPTLLAIGDLERAAMAEEAVAPLDDRLVRVVEGVAEPEELGLDGAEQLERLLGRIPTISSVALELTLEAGENLF